jgi:hypothetical protein
MTSLTLSTFCVSSPLLMSTTTSIIMVAAMKSSPRRVAGSFTYGSSPGGGLAGGVIAAIVISNLIFWGWYEEPLLHSVFPNYYLYRNALHRRHSDLKSSETL